MTARPVADYVPAFLRLRAAVTGGTSTMTMRVEPWYPPRPRDPFNVFTDNVRRHLRKFGIFATGFRLQHFQWRVEIRMQDKARAWYRLSDVLKDPLSYRTADV